MGNKGEKIKVMLGCFAEQIRLRMLTPKELEFAVGLSRRYEFSGDLSDAQVEAGWKMLVRLMKEREVPF